MATKRTTTAYIVDISPPAAPFLPSLRDALTASIMMKAARPTPHDEVALITYGGPLTDNAAAAEAEAAGDPGQYAGIVNASRAVARARWGGPPEGVGALGRDADGAVQKGLLSVWHPARRAALLTAIAGIGAHGAPGGGGAAAPPHHPADAMDALLVAADAVSSSADPSKGGRETLTGRGAATRFILISPFSAPSPSGEVDAVTTASFVAAAATLGASLEVVVAHPPADPADGPGRPPPSHPALLALAPILAALPTRVDLRVGCGPEGVAGALADPGVGSTVHWSGELDLLTAPLHETNPAGPPPGEGTAAAAAAASREPSPGGASSFSLAVKLSKRTAPSRPPTWEAVVEEEGGGGGGGGAGAPQPQKWARVERAVTYRAAGVGAATAAAATAEAGADPNAPVPMAVDAGARIPAWRYGGEWVPVPDPIKARLGFASPKGLSLVGFAVPAPPPTAGAPSNGVWLMAPSPAAGPGNRDALGALARATQRVGGAAILRWVGRNGSPRLYAGYPALPGEFAPTADVAALEAELAGAMAGGGAAGAAPAALPPTHPSVFVLVELPFLEDVRPLRFPGFPLPGDHGEDAGYYPDAPSAAQLDAAVSLVDAWDVSRRAAPETLPNPVRLRSLAWAGARALAVADGATDFPQPVPPPSRLSELGERTVGGAGVAVPAPTDAAGRCVYAGAPVPGSVAAAAAAAFAAAFQGTVRESPEPGDKERSEAKKKEGGKKGSADGGRGRGARSPTRSEGE